MEIFRDFIRRGSCFTYFTYVHAQTHRRMANMSSIQHIAQCVFAPVLSRFFFKSETDFFVFRPADPQGVS